MLVLSMNSKRQRRPNVRLGEIGDVSAAAHSCGVTQRSKEDFEEKGWKQSSLDDPKETVIQRPFGFSDFAVSNPGGSARASKLTLNREYCIPGSAKPETDSSNKPSLNFGSITRKGRVMKRKGRSLSRAWSSRVGADDSEKGYCKEDGYGYDVYTPEKYSDHETSESPDYAKALGAAAEAPSPDAAVVDFECSLGHHLCKESHQEFWVDSVLDQQGNGDSTEFWMTGKEGNILSCDADHGLELSGERPCRSNDDVNGSFWEQRIGNKTIPVVDSVKAWLDELGFSKYAHIFENHEVDKEVLPFLTFDDLKEMGILAVGPRRKLYTAIQLLKEGLSA